MAKKKHTNENKKTPLDKLTSKIYTRGGVRKEESDRSYLHPNKVDAPKEWMEDEERVTAKKKPQTPFVMKVFWFSVAFFVVALTIVLLVFLGGSNVVSSENVIIDVSGPPTIEAGSEVTLQILIENKNDVALESTDLIITFPTGTRGVGENEGELTRMRTTLKTIPPGVTATKTIRAIFFGQEGSTKNLNLELEYRVEGSNAIFVAEKTHEVSISASPIDITIDSVKEISSGQDFSLAMTIRGDGEEVIDDLLLRVDYPFGFTFTDASPSPTFDNAVWELGDLAPGSERTITINGVMEGQDGEEKVFRIESGAQSTNDSTQISVVYNSWLSSVSIARPFLGLQFRLNGDALDSYSVKSTQELRGEIEWINNTPTKITDAEIELTLSGEVLDKSSLRVREGVFKSVENTILWTSETKPALSEIEPGETGVVQFEFAARSLFPDGVTIYKSPTIHIDTTARGERLSERGVPREVTSGVERDIRIISDVGFSGRAVYFSGPFNNVGPLPPKVDTQTSYTILWSFVNSSNTIADGTIRATLPQNVSWSGAVSPSDESVVYDEREHTVTWDMGVIRSGVGITRDPREVAFQVFLVPSITDLGREVTLIEEALFTGSDEFAEREIRVNIRPLSTEISTDPQYVRGQEKVVE